MTDQATLEALITGAHGDPFRVLGPHADDDGWHVRCLYPDASAVEYLDASGTARPCEQVHPAGVFEIACASQPGAYRFRVHWGDASAELEDPYRFPSSLGDIDRYLLSEGTHLELANVLGARVTVADGVAGVRFGVWAPNAQRVSVVGNFNEWDGRRHPMRLHPGNGVWELFVPGLAAGSFYKYEIVGAGGERLPLKADPLARQMEAPPGNASVVSDSRYAWRDESWLEANRGADQIPRPMSVYEVHLGSWRRDESGQMLDYQTLARELVPYVKSLGFTHIELLPVAEHPFDGSWGYQPIGLFAPTYRFGTPDDFKYFVDECHEHGIGVILDWVPAHFPKDDYGLGRFDGTALYEHADPRQGEHSDWGTLIYNFDRAEVVNYLLASALWWVTEYHVDGIRVDAVASMLYLDYSRSEDAWVPNRYGGNENLGAVEFLKRLNVELHAAGAFVIAEESTSWPQVSGPVWRGGLGFTFKWNMGWMHDTLEYMGHDAVHRSYHQDRLTFGLLYAFSENFVLPLSHDEVVHGKGSLIGKMSGDRWQKFANLRAYYGFMWAYPGKKLLFMGGEFAQEREWNHDQSLDWHLLDVGRDDGLHVGVQRVLGDLNRCYVSAAALHAGDCRGDGFAWIDCADKDQSVLAFRRRDGDHEMIVVTHFTPVMRTGYRIGVPQPGTYEEILNTDATTYGGSGCGNFGAVTADDIPAHGLAWSLELTLPPLSTLYLRVRSAS